MKICWHLVRVCDTSHVQEGDAKGKIWLVLNSFITGTSFHQHVNSKSKKIEAPAATSRPGFGQVREHLSGNHNHRELKNIYLFQCFLILYRRSLSDDILWAAHRLVLCSHLQTYLHFLKKAVLLMSVITCCCNFLIKN